MQLTHPRERLTRDSRIVGCVLLVSLFVIYNANGREIPSADTQPTKFLALEIVTSGSLTLDGVVARTPALALRGGFQQDRLGHYRSAYPVSPALAAGGMAALLSGLGLVDLGAPLAAAFVAKLTASLLTAAAVVLTYFCAARQLGPSRAVWLAVGLGLGTNYWATTSQTLWQHDLAAVGLAGLVFAVGPSFRSMGTSARWGAGLALAIAVAARPQLVFTAGVLVWPLILYRRRYR